VVSRLLKESLQKQTDEAFPDQSVAKQVDDTVPPEEVGLLKEAKEFALDATPVVGEVRAAKRIYDAVKNRNLVEAGVEALGLGLGLIPGVGDVAAKGVRGAYKAIKGADFQNYVPEKTRTAYKLFVKGDDEKLYPLFVNATKEVPKDKWIEADFPSAAFKAKNGKMYVPSKGGKRQATKYYDAEGSEITKKEYDSLGANQKEFASVVKGEQAKGTGVAINIPDEATRKKLIDEGYITEKAGKTKEAPHGKVTAVAARPGWHASQMPVATHIGPQDIKINIEERLKLLKAGITPEAIKRRGKQYYVKRRAEDHVYAEVQMADDVNYQTALLNSNKTDINNFVPRGGSYKYVDGQADSDKWVVGGDIKVTKVLSREESRALQKKLGVKDLPYRSEIEAILGKKFNEGGLAGGKTMYEGVDDYQLNSMGEDMAENTTEKQMNFAFMNEGGVLADDGVERDPVSGNEVPSGSMAEEVRDDIPAMLSEGEYVVPADVVRYHGIQTFEDLRNEAKVGLQRMEADGRIGGQPVEEQDELPFSVEELEVTEAYRGGIMGFQEGGDTGTYEDTFGGPFVANQRYGTVGTGPAQLGFQLRNFTSSVTGKTVTIPFYNGKPMQYIPPEFTASDVVGSGGAGTFDPAADERSRQEDEAERARDTGDAGSAFDLPSGFDSMPSTPPKKISEMSPADLLEIKNTRDTIGGKLLSAVPIVGFLMGLQEKEVKNAAFEILKNNKNPATGEKLNAADVSALRAITEGPERKGALEIIGDWMTGQKFFDPNPRIGYESGQDFRQMYPDILKTEYKPAPKTAPDFVTMSEIGTSDPTPVDTQTEQFFPEELTQQESGFADATVAEQAKDILANEEAIKTEKARKANKDAGERLDKILRPLVNLFSNVQGDPDDSAISPSLVGAAMAGDRASYTGPLQVTNVEELGGDDVTNLLVNSFAKQGLDSNSVNYRGLLSKLAVESDEYNKLIETSMNYSHDAFIKNFGQDKYNLAKSMLRPIGSDGSTNAPDAANVPALFNIAYAGKNGNGSVESGDGYKFRGRAYVMLTGEANYANVGKILGVDLVNMSEQELNNWFSNEQNSADATAAYFSMRQREGQDLSTIDGINTAVGGTVDGKARAVEIYNKRHADQQPYTTDIPVTALTQTQARQRPTYDRPQTLGVPFTQPDPTQQVALDQRARDTSPVKPTVPYGTIRADQSGDPYAPIEGRSSGAISDFMTSPAYTGDVSQLYGRGFTPEQIGTDPRLQRTGQRGGIPELNPLDRSFIQRESMGADIGPLKRPATPIVKRDFLDPNMSMSRREVLSDPTRFTGPAGAGIGPMSEDEKIQLGLGRDYTDPYGGISFEEQGRSDIDPSRPQPSISSAINQTETMLGDAGGVKGRLPQVGKPLDRPMLDKVESPDMTPLSKPSDISKLIDKASKDAAKKAVEDAISFAPKTPKKTKPKEEPKKEKPKKEKPKKEEPKKKKEVKVPGVSIDKAQEASQDVFMATGDAFAADKAFHEAFTGFTSTGELSPTYGFGFKEGGLASRPKKTKPKKRNVKKGLGGKMAT